MTNKNKRNTVIENIKEFFMIEYITDEFIKKLPVGTNIIKQNNDFTLLIKKDIKLFFKTEIFRIELLYKSELIIGFDFDEVIEEIGIHNVFRTIGFCFCRFYELGLIKYPK